MCLTQEIAPVVYNAASDIYLEDQKNATKPMLLKYSHYRSPSSNFRCVTSSDLLVSFDTSEYLRKSCNFYEEYVSI